jgi:hypothetical protein
MRRKVGGGGECCIGTQHTEKAMRFIVFALALLATAATARAQDAIPDLRGTWSGKGKSIVFGSGDHHPGSQTAADPPRVRDIEATHTVEDRRGASLGVGLHPRSPTPRSRSRGRSRATTRPSSAPIGTAIFTSLSSRPTVWRSAACTMA